MSQPERNAKVYEANSKDARLEEQVLSRKLS
jgi:hypothetical protein